MLNIIRRAVSIGCLALCLCLAACSASSEPPQLPMESSPVTAAPQETVTEPPSTQPTTEPTTEAVTEAAPEPSEDVTEETEPPAPAEEPDPVETFSVYDMEAYQIGEPVTPQPGDTKDSWQPELAAQYPADENCSDEELLEKWLTVEGLTYDDLTGRGCEQLVLVAAQEGEDAQAIVCCYEKRADGTWEPVPYLSRMQGWTGKKGIMHDRRRHSYTSPAGLWALGTAFGNAPMPDGLKLPWRDVTDNSDWVMDEESIYFNTWRERGDPSLTGTWGDDVEHLANYQNAYAYACVVQFNNPPYTIPDRGCAIFLHCSKGGTEGCIGLPEGDMVSTLLWLDPLRCPYILITGCQVTEAE